MTAPGDDVATVEVGHRPPWRWLAVAAVAVWIVAAVVVSLVGGDDGGEDDAQAASSSTSSSSTSTSTTSTTRPPTTTTTLFVPGAPLLGGPAGFDLIVTTPQRSYVLDLDTGETVPFPYRDVARIDADGLFASGADDLEHWHPFPLDGGVGVPVSDALRENILRVPGADWVYTQEWNEETAVTHIRRVSLVDGGVTESFDLPRDAGYADATEAGLVVGAAGDAYLATGAGIRRVAAGELVAAGGRRVYLRRCDERLRCWLVDHDVVTGDEQAIDQGGLEWTRSDGRLLDGRPVLQAVPSRHAFVYAVPDGDHLRILELPSEVVADGLFFTAWWAPGDLLVLLQGDLVRILDVFADGGPVERARFELPGLPENGGVSVAVLPDF